MKSGRGKGAPDRERGYWEAPRSAFGRIEARIEEPSEIEQPPVGPLTRRQKMGRSLWLRRRLVAVGVSAVAVVVAGVVTISGPKAHAQAIHSPEPSSDATASASDDLSAVWTYVPYVYETPVPVATDDPYQFASDPPQTDPTDPPVVLKGWPITVLGGLQGSDAISGQFLVGPDGTTYIPGIPALDATGHARKDWLRLPGGGDATAVAFGSDATIYAIDDTSSGDGSNSPDSPGTQLYGYAPNGKLRAGWPIDVGDSPSFEAGPGGTLYVISSDGSNMKATVLTPSGKTKASWNIGSDKSGTCGDVIRSDGTLFYAYSTPSAATCSVLVFSPTGKLLSGSPVRGWDGLVLGPDDTVVAYGRDSEPYDVSVVARTKYAVIGTDGLAAPGWPVYVEGAGSDPAIGPDGSIYVAQLGLGTAVSRIFAYDKSGILESGWPVDLPSGYGAFAGGEGDIPLPLIVGADGTVYVAATNSDWMGSIIALDHSGAVVPGWPYQLPQAFADVSGGGMGGATSPGPTYVRLPSGGGLLYLGLEGEVVALGSDGKVAPGWPYLLPQPKSGTAYLDDWAGTPDGGILILTDVDGQDDTTNVFVRLATSGKTER